MGSDDTCGYGHCACFAAWKSFAVSRTQFAHHSFMISFRYGSGSWFRMPFMLMIGGTCSWYRFMVPVPGPRLWHSFMVPLPAR